MKRIYRLLYGTPDPGPYAKFAVYWAFFGSIIVLIVGWSRAAVIDRPAPSGSTVEVDGKLVATVTDKPVTIKLPGDDLRLVPPVATPTTAPSTQPTTKPSPGVPVEPTTKPSDPIENAVQFKIRKGDPMPGRFIGGTAAKPIVVGFDRAGTWTGTLNASSYTTYVPYGTGPGPFLNASTAVRVGSGVKGVIVRGFKGIAPTGSTGHAVDILATNVDGVTIEDCDFRNFYDGVRIQNYPGDPTLLGIKNVTLSRLVLLDMQGRGLKEGHGLFAIGVDGLLVDTVYIEGAGMVKAIRDDYTHGMYIQHGTRHVVVRNCWVAHCENIGIMARGPRNDASNSSDASDPGPNLLDNIAEDCAIGLFINGPRGKLIGNFILPGHTLTNVKQNRVHGQAGFMAHLGAGEVRDNVRLYAPIPKSPYTRMPAFAINPRPLHAEIPPWPWRFGVNPVEDNNLDFIGDRTRLVNLDDLRADLRAGRRGVAGSIKLARERIENTLHPFTK